MSKELRCDVLYLGEHLKLEAVRGTKGPGTRLGIHGLNGNSAEIELVPGPGCQESGVVSQIQFLAPRSDKGYARFALGVNRDSDGGDYAVVDMTESGTRKRLPLVVNSGEGRPSIYIDSDGVVTVNEPDDWKK